MKPDDLQDAIVISVNGDKVMLGLRQNRLLHEMALEPYQAKIIAKNLTDAAVSIEAKIVERVTNS